MIATLARVVEVILGIPPSLSLIGAVIAAAISSPAFADGSFSQQLSCASGLSGHAGGTGFFLEKNAKAPGALERVGYLVEGKHSGKDGFYLFKENEAYFVAYPSTMKEYVDSKYPKAEPARFLWAEVPQKSDHDQGKVEDVAGVVSHVLRRLHLKKSGKTDNFEMTIQGGSIVSDSDEIGFNIGRKEWPDSVALFKEYMVKSRGKSAMGAEASSALLKALESKVDAMPAAYGSEVRLFNQRRMPGPDKNELLAALDRCAAIDDPTLKDKVARAKASIEKMPAFSSPRSYRAGSRFDAEREAYYQKLRGYVDSPGSSEVPAALTYPAETVAPGPRVPLEP
jgi:hypothetical protein